MNTINSLPYAGIDLSRYTNLSAEKKPDQLTTRINEYFHNVVRTYNEAMTYVYNLKPKTKEAISIALDMDDMNTVVILTELYRNIPDTTLHVDLESAKKISNEQKYLVNCSYYHSSFTLILTEKEYATAKLKE